MNWDFNYLRFMALNAAVGSIIVYTPLAMITHTPSLITYMASLGFMLGWMSQ